MTDQMFRDLLAVILIGSVLIITGTGHNVDPQVKEWADVAFGFLFGFKTAGYTIGKMNGNSTTVASTTTVQEQTTSDTPTKVS